MVFFHNVPFFDTQNHPNITLLSIFLSFIGQFLRKSLDLVFKTYKVWENLRSKRINPASSGSI